MLCIHSFFFFQLTFKSISMAEKRKLLNEIDKCFKKVEEGVELFEETMAKMQEANSDNQREKFQDDLKKEIKKLQRLRDQIKGWQNSSDIKDKDKLTSYRKLIEQRMEQFKDIERENKTKPHSKQGLSAEEKLDPREKEKTETVEWLQCQIRYLEDEADKTESQIESLSTADQTRKKGKRDDPKKGEKEKLKRLDDLRKHLERIRFHVSKLEICMRLVNNETLESKRVMDALKEPFEMYIESLDPESENDPESFDPETTGVYDELDLQSYTPQLGGAIFGSVDSDEKMENNIDGRVSPASSPAPVLPKETDDNTTKQRHLSGEPNALLTRQISASRSTPATPLKLTNQVSGESSLSSPPPPATPPPPPGIPYSVAVGLGTKNTKGSIVQTSVKQPVEVSVSSQATAALSPGILPTSRSSTPDSNVAKRFSVSSSTSSHHEIATLKSMAAQASSLQNSVTITTALNMPPSTVTHSATALVTSQVNSEMNNALNMATVTAGSTAVNATTVSLQNNVAGNDIDQNALRQVLRMSTTQDARNHLPQALEMQAVIPAWLGASPLGRSPVMPEHETQLKLLEHALTRTPLPMDSEKPRSYLPKMPCVTATYYPQAPLINADTLEYYLRLSPETLFFAFYYMEGSRAQLLAAKALKKLSWRFHTKYLMWFQRHEEPKQITDDYEQGTYVYFDYEKWSQRKKEQFTFEYRYLEDKDFD
uniref:Not1 domain-containing protein n=1 Tax=Wuchereria bancrofti TaxID=6293 RepID=A0A1I8ENS2_WUCBA